MTWPTADQRKHILYVETGSGYGGSARCLYDLLNALNRNRYLSTVVSHGDGSGIQQIQLLGVPVRIMAGPSGRTSGPLALLARLLLWELPMTVRLVRLIMREQVEVVHVNNDLYSAAAGVWAGKLTRRPVVCHLRLTRTPTRLERWLGRLPDCLIVLTQYAKQFYQPHWPHQRIEVIPDAIALNGAGGDSPESLRGTLGLAQSGPVVGLLARCVPGKGYEEFIRAASIICRQDSKAQFLIVGNGHGGDQAHEIQMQELAKQLKLQQRLLWAGWQRDTAAILDLLDIVVQASSTFPEGLSRVLLEAMAHGRPVVATSLPSTQEIITHGETGLLVEPGNSQALAEGILTLLRQPELAARYARRGREHVAAHFSLTEHARRITTLYDEVLGIGPGNGRRSERGTRSQVLAGD